MPESARALPPVRRLGAADLPALLELQAIVGATAPGGFLWPKADAELAGYLAREERVAFGITMDDRLVAAGLLRLPNAARPNGGPPFRHVPAADWQHLAAFSEHTMVLPACRGCGAQRALIAARLAHARTAGQRWLCAGVRLANRTSWVNLLAAGFVIADMRRDLGAPMIGLLAALQMRWPVIDPDTPARLVPAPDDRAHEAALDADTIGVALAAGSVEYRRLAGGREPG